MRRKDIRNAILKKGFLITTIFVTAMLLLFNFGHLPDVVAKERVSDQIDRVDTYALNDDGSLSLLADEEGENPMPPRT